jgi:Zn-dependent peptidase ImmA (M78 family)/transcriptional regulator with XRE-family HTH domain
MSAATRKERPQFNPEMLRWARKHRGRTLEEAAAKLGKTRDQILEWEQNQVGPTVNQVGPTVKQARALADFYERSFLEFFRKSRPPVREPQLVPDFRTARGAPNPSEERGLKAIQAWAEAQRDNALDLYEELGEQPPTVPGEIFTTVQNSPERSAAKARRALGFTFAEQSGLKAAEHDKLPTLIRKKLEHSGILALKRSDMHEFRTRGLCIAAFPLPVVIFGNESPGAQAFTLAHELAHIALKESGIIAPDTSTSSGRRAMTERWCDRFAASFLMPREEITSRMGGSARAEDSAISDADLSALATAFRVSPHAMLIRLVHLGYVSPAYYWEVKKPAFDQEEREYKRFARAPYYGNPTGPVLETFTLDSCWKLGAPAVLPIIMLWNILVLKA